MTEDDGYAALLATYTEGDIQMLKMAARRGVQYLDDYSPSGDADDDETCQSCSHDWVERDQGPGFRWRECWLCGVMTDWLPDDRR